MKRLKLKCWISSSNARNETPPFLETRHGRVLNPAAARYQFTITVEADGGRAECAQLKRAISRSAVLCLSETETVGQ